MSKMLKNDMIDGIEYHFRKQGKRLTNLRKVPMSKLEEMIKKYNVNIVDEVNELKTAREQAKKNLDDEREERKRLLDEKNNLCIKKYIELTNAQRDQFYEKIFEEANADNNREMNVGKSLTDVLYNKFKSEGARVIRESDTVLIVNGIHVHNGHDYKPLDKDEYITELKSEILTDMYRYEKVLDEVINSWFDIVVPVKKPKTKKVKKVKKVVEEPEQFCCCCSGKRDVWYNLGAPDTPMCPCNPDFEGDAEEYYKDEEE